MEVNAALKFLKNEDVGKNLNPQEYDSLINCYVEVFNESFPKEGWTFESAKQYIDESFIVTENRKLALSFITKDGSVVGFSWITLTDPDHILPIDLPNNLSTTEITYAIKVIKSWVKMAGHEKLVFFRETAVLKDYRIINKHHTSTILHIPLYEYADEEDYKILFYWTNYFGSGFKLGIQVGWHPIVFFPEADRVIIKGGVKNCIKYLTGIDQKEKWVFDAMRNNAREYFIQSHKPKGKI